MSLGWSLSSANEPSAKISVIPTCQSLARQNLQVVHQLPPPYRIPGWRRLAVSRPENKNRAPQIVERHFVVAGRQEAISCKWRNHTLTPIITSMLARHNTYVKHDTNVSSTPKSGSIKGSRPSRYRQLGPTLRPRLVPLPLHRCDSHPSRRDSLGSCIVSLSVGAKRRVPMRKPRRMPEIQIPLSSVGG